MNLMSALERVVPGTIQARGREYFGIGAVKSVDLDDDTLNAIVRGSVLYDVLLVLDLQKNKRNLADAIINEDNSLIRDLQREDLELLLG
jgi:uncharacterized Zn finger protein